MEMYTVAVIARNQFGVLNRVTSMLRRRQLNLSGLLVSETESPELSRIVIRSQNPVLCSHQLMEQLKKLQDVYSVQEISNGEAGNWEMLLRAENENVHCAEVSA